MRWPTVGVIGQRRPRRFAAAKQADRTGARRGASFGWIHIGPGGVARRLVGGVDPSDPAIWMARGRIDSARMRARPWRKPVQRDWVGGASDKRREHLAGGNRGVDRRPQGARAWGRRIEFERGLADRRGLAVETRQLSSAAIERKVASPPARCLPGLWRARTGRGPIALIFSASWAQGAAAARWRHAVEARLSLALTDRATL